MRGNVTVCSPPVDNRVGIDASPPSGLWVAESHLLDINSVSREREREDRGRKEVVQRRETPKTYEAIASGFSGCPIRDDDGLKDIPELLKVPVHLDSRCLPLKPPDEHFGQRCVPEL